MIIYLKDIDTEYAFIFDTEYDANTLIQFAGILLKKVGNNLYQVAKSFNQYIKADTCNFFTRFTGITQEFINKNGINTIELKDKFFNEFLEGMILEDITCVSHGIKQDLQILLSNNIDLSKSKFICSYELSKKALKREIKLTLSDIMSDAGLVPINSHNAYSDALSTTLILSYLLKIYEV